MHNIEELGVKEHMVKFSLFVLKRIDRQNFLIPFGRIPGRIVKLKVKRLPYSDITVGARL